MIALSRVEWAGGPRGAENGTNAFVSFDGGATWTPSVLADTSLRLGGDGLVYITREGIPFMVVGTGVNGIARTVIGRSTDGGRTFGNRVALPYRDRPWMAFDTTGFTGKGLFDGVMYLVGQSNGMVVSRSTDGGLTWSYADQLKRDEGGPDPSVQIGGIPGDMLITDDGSVVITYYTSGVEPKRVARLANDTVITSRLDFLVSEDAGRTWLGVRRGPPIHTLRSYRGHQALQAARSAIETRGKRRGRIYTTWPEYDDVLDRYAVQLGRTDDVGKTWQTVVVSDSLIRGSPSNATVAVSKDGVVAVTWYDRRDDPKRNCWRLYGAISLDGGEHFLANQKLSEAPTCTNTPGNWIMSAIPQFDVWTDPVHPRPAFHLRALVPVRFANGGETQGLEADRDGVFHAAWINGETGVMQLWHTSFAVDPALLMGLREPAPGQIAETSVGRVTPGRMDLSSVLRFNVSEPRIDFTRGTLEVTMRINNIGLHPIRYPIDVMVEAPLSGMNLKRLRVANADNKLDGIGATWTFGAPSGSLLAPGDASAPKVLRFQFDGGIPREPQQYFTPRLGVYGSQTTR